MPVACGVRLGPYEIQSLIGAGGMGEVYRARDTRLDRTVAIKLLPAELSADPERRARFEREAHTIAQLAHPHICTIYDVGSHEGTTYLVMEYLAGDTLAARIAKGPLPVAQVLEIAAQIAEGLAAAHKAGIVHRDLKPANIMLVRGPTVSGPPVVKLLDFGLAKLTGHGEDPAARLATTAVVPASLTGHGTIVGTLPYMAPEQLEGQEADARTDIWALGAILYEMITGRRAFEGTTPASLMGAILEREPPPITIGEPLAPPALDRLLRKCLAKAPDDRWHSAHDLADELRWLADTDTHASAVAAPTASWLRSTLVLVLPSMIVGAVLAGAGVWSLRPAAAARVVRAQLDVLPSEEIYGQSGLGSIQSMSTRGGSRTAFTWTPAGEALVFVGRRAGRQQLYVRDLDGFVGRPLAGTEDALMPVVPPDGRWVVFWAKGELRRVPLDGGPPQTIGAAVVYPPFGLAADATGRVAYGREDGRIWLLTSGSPPTALTRLEKGELAHVLPQWAADGVLLYTSRTTDVVWGGERVVAQALATGERKVLLEDAADARFMSTGHLLFLRRGLLMAVPFDLDRLRVTGPPVGVLDGVAQALTAGSGLERTGAGQFSISSSGSLAYVPSPLVPYPDATLASVDRQGRVTTLPFEPHPYNPPLRLSPDGHRLAISTSTLTEHALWIADLTRGSFTKLTSGGEAAWPRWTPDSERIAFMWLEHGIGQVAWQRADGSSPPERLAVGEMVPSCWSPDGQHLAVVKEDDIWVISAGQSPPTLARMTQTPESEWSPEFSPDGRWLAYASNKTGRFEVYVRPYPGPGPSTAVSIAGGNLPAWNPRGGELFFLQSVSEAAQTYRMMAVPIEGSRPGTPRPLFDVRGTDLTAWCGPNRCYDVAQDGQQFLVRKLIPREPAAPVTHVNLVLDWVEELKAKVPVRAAK